MTNVAKMPNPETRGHTAIFLFPNTKNPLGVLKASCAFWKVFRYLFGYEELIGSISQTRLTNLLLMPPILCGSEWRLESFQGANFSCILIGVQEPLPNKVECGLPEASLTLWPEYSGSLLEKLRRGWEPLIPQKKAGPPILAFPAHVATA